MSRGRVLWHYLRARRRRFTECEQLRAWQQTRVSAVVRSAPARYSFYAGMTPRDLSDLPILDKPQVIENFAGLNVVGADLQDCLAAARAAERGRDFSTQMRGLSVGLSSGTSGQQTAFLTSAAERDRWAGEVLARALPGGLRHGARVTLVLRAGGPLYESVNGGRVSFRFVDLALPIEQLVQQVRGSAPTILVAPPSILVILAREGLDRVPERVFSVAEVLDPHDEEEIGRKLGCRVDQVYQAAEGFLGVSCAQGRLHLNEDLVFFEREPVAEDRFVPVITDLFRVSQAVIRRRLADILVTGKPCPCGQVTTVVDSIAGRSDDTLCLSRREGGSAEFFPDFVRAAVLAVPQVGDFRVVQTAADAVELAVEPAAHFDEARRALTGALTRAGFAVPTITAGKIPPRDPGRKLRRVRRLPSVRTRP